MLACLLHAMRNKAKSMTTTTPAITTALTGHRLGRAHASGGALADSLLVLLVARSGGRVNSLCLLLAGVAIN